MIPDIYRRNDFLIKATLRDEDETPLDLTGTTVLFEVRQLVSTDIMAGDIVIEKRTNAGIHVVNAVGGEIEIPLTAGDTDVAPGSYVYEVLVKDVEGRRYTIGQGRMTVRASLLAQKEAD